MASRLLGNSENQRNPPSKQVRKPSRRQFRRDLAAESASALKESHDLEQTLRQRGCLPMRNDEDEQRRLDALGTLETILCDWAASVQTTEKDDTGKQPRVSLVTFGSYRLRVHRPESDLDVLAMSPSTCCRGDFFTTLVQALQKDPRINDVHAIPSAYTVCT